MSRTAARTSKTVILLVLLLSFSGTQILGEDEAMVASICEEVNGIRGLPFLFPVPHKLMTREQLRDYLLGEGDDTESEVAQKVLVAFHAWSPAENLTETVMAFYAGSVEGFYSDETHSLSVVIDSHEPVPYRKMIIAHELTHALQDQHFNLTLINEQIEEAGGDEALALLSLIEGDATLVQMIYVADRLSRHDQREIEEYLPPDGGVPPLIEEMLFFPYVYGTDFVAYLHQEGGWGAVDQAYTNPPTTTEQILHPKKYLEGEGPIPLELDFIPSLGNWTTIDEDALGEFGIRLVLGSNLSKEDAKRAAEGWGGDYYLCSEHEGRKVLAFISEWDSRRDAAEFYRAYWRHVREAGATSSQRFNLCPPNVWLPVPGVQKWEIDDARGLAIWDGTSVFIAETDDPEMFRMIEHQAIESLGDHRPQPISCPTRCIGDLC